jgi:hypothetical protein
VEPVVDAASGDPADEEFDRGTLSPDGRPPDGN